LEHVNPALLEPQHSFCTQKVAHVQFAAPTQSEGNGKHATPLSSLTPTRQYSVAIEQRCCIAEMGTPAGGHTNVAPASEDPELDAVLVEDDDVEDEDDVEVEDVEDDDVEDVPDEPPVEETPPGGADPAQLATAPTTTTTHRCSSAVIPSVRTAILVCVETGFWLIT
jgi:hypothetical protein